MNARAWLAAAKLIGVALLVSTTGFGQSDRGTVTGTVSDPGGAIVPNVAVVARNVETGSVSQTVTTETGNFTLPSLPAGRYDIKVEAPGFKTFIAKGTQVQVAQTIRIDAVLELGATTETVSVEATAPLLRTENAEQSVNITGDRINQLPLNFGGGGGQVGGIRNPMTFMILSPGVSGSGTGARVNGAPGNTFRVMLEGQDTTSGNAEARANETQASVESIEEFSLQTSQFAAEYGQALGGIFNFTTRSGTNQFHGSLYEYLVNEALAAHRPFTNVRPSSRKHNFGGSLGGPVWIPKVYDGHNKTFFFFNWEYFRNKVAANGTYQTVPTEAFRRGDFSSALTGKQLGVDPLGRPIMENAIYDPATSRVVNGVVVRDPFPGNIIPQNRLDPVALKVQSLIPAPDNPFLFNNWQQSAPTTKIQSIPGIKIDHSFSDSSKTSFYYSKQRTDQVSSADSLPVPITGRRDQFIYAHTTRLNYDHTLSPTLLLHLGSGFIRYLNPDSSPRSVLEDYDAVAGIGFVGGATRGFPRLNALGAGNFGGMSISLGPSNANYYYNDKWTSVASMTYVRGNHTYKLGGEFRIDIFTDRNSRGSTGVLGFAREQTGLPSTQQNPLTGGSVGHNYASFLLGHINTASVNAVQDPQWRKNSWGLYIQDTWKATRRLTIDYGLRWDRQEPGSEIHDRVSTLGANVANPAAGGLPGALVYEGNGPGRCNCKFADVYPYAIGPRLGVAYQINDKTVFRGGWGIAYGNVRGLNYITNQTWYGVGFDAISFESPAFGEPGAILRDGLQYDVSSLYRATLDPGLLPRRGQTNAPPVILDPNGGRPPRINQWSIGLQREVIPNLTVEAAYVGNRAVWVHAPGLSQPNVLSPERLRAFGLDMNNATDRALLTQRIDASAVVARGFRPPYEGFPNSANLAQALRPFPQFSSSLEARTAPLGNTWYDSLQVKATKRYSHGLDFTVAFTWQKELESTGAYNDVFNRPNQKSIANGSQPLITVIGFNYEVPRLAANNLVNSIVSGWTIGGILRYASGTPIQVPNSQNGLNNQLFQGTVMNRVPGEPLYLKDPNCGCIDPYKDLILNPKAWVDVPAGQWGTAARYYNDYRNPRVPDEQMSIGRSFRFKERAFFQIRAEFFNVFNRTILFNSNLTTTNPFATSTSNAQGLSGGFGYFNPTNIGQPRNGQIVARIQF
ncbi:MAG TPA: TonB-dependent receptor [Bryobacteraceae bacterium]|nr:TonB-dependent receptor [Bryobacteraceae bacterium]